ncbi:MAG: hypothetical protein WCG25_01835 [bacterium]
MGISVLCHTCTIKGLLEGLFLSSKIFETAWISKAFAHSQYTVSVGKATTPQSIRSCLASWKVLDVGR